MLRRGRYVLAPPSPVHDVRALTLDPGAVVAFDCPIGVSREYAAMAGLGSFREALGIFGAGRFSRFYEPAARAEDIATERPFYPLRGLKGTRRADLRRALGEAGFAPRECDRLARAGPIFWLVGPRQVGRSAACVWRDVITPNLGRVALWPFDGPLTELVASGRPIVAEMYPAILLRTLGAPVTRKSDPAARGGFGRSNAGEDPFDATIACIALAKLFLNGAVPEPPAEACRIEGWILGLGAS